jgi:hypothetical protein
MESLICEDDSSDAEWESYTGPKGIISNLTDDHCFLHSFLIESVPVYQLLQISIRSESWNLHPAHVAES